MPTRFVAFVLALVLLWSGFATHEQATSLALTQAESADDAAQVAGLSAASSGPFSGSVDEHHLDDLPAQTLVEHAADLPGLTTAVMPWSDPAAIAWATGPWHDAARPAPFLEGLRRPPRAA